MSNEINKTIIMKLKYYIKHGIEVIVTFYNNCINCTFAVLNDFL